MRELSEPEHTIWDLAYILPMVRALSKCVFIPLRIKVKTALQNTYRAGAMFSILPPSCLPSVPSQLFFTVLT